MDTILDFIVDNYIWIVIICVFLILVLIGFIADQKIKLKKIREQKSQGVVSSDINVPVQENVVQTANVAPAPVAAEPVVSEPVIGEPIVSNEVIETPTFEPVENVVKEPVPVPEVTEPVVESVVEPVVESVSEPVVEVASDNLFSEPIFEEVPQTILDIPDNVADIKAPVQEEVVEEPIIEDTEIIEEPEIIEEVTPENIVNTWEPELKTENPEIINEIQIEDSI